MQKIILLSFVLSGLFLSCKKQTVSSSETTELSGVSETVAATTLSNSATTYNNESSIDGDGLTNPRLIAALPSTLYRTLWGTYDIDFQAFNATAGTTYNVSVSNYDINNDQVSRFRLEVYKGTGSSIAFVSRAADGEFATSFTATESVRYTVRASDQNSDLNTGRSLGDYSITITSGSGSETVAQLSGISIAPGTVVGGNNAIGTVTLTTSAPAGGISVSVSSNNSLATTPATVLIPAGSTSRQFNISTVRTNRNRVATITATYNGISRSANLTIAK